MIGLYKSFFFLKRTYIATSLIAALFFIGQYFNVVFYIALATLILLALLLTFDFILLYINRISITAKRIVGDKLSNGDFNDILVKVTNNSKMKLYCELIDEVPMQFQFRNNIIKFNIEAQETLDINYQLRPTKRGEYEFSDTNLFISSFLKLIQRKFIFEGKKEVAVYPSFLQMRKFAFLAISNRLSEYGVKKIRKRGSTLEFEQIREYTPGDDYRLINWKASAKRSNLMINQYQDERSQNIVNIIDMGRNMKMPFDEITLLDYAINSSLILSNIAIQKFDKAGLITFSEDINSMVLPSKKKNQITTIQQYLYKQETNFLEPNFEKLYLSIRHNIKQRSLLIIYTNFETVSNMKRNMDYILALTKFHVVVVVFFENIEISSMLEITAHTKPDVFRKVTSEKYYLEKQTIVELLNKAGVHTVLTKPQELSVKTINKYLEIKSKRLV